MKLVMEVDQYQDTIRRILCVQPVRSDRIFDVRLAMLTSSLSIYMIKRRVAIIFEGITICGISNLRYVIHVDQLGLIKQVKCMNILKNGRKL